ncbi:MAG: hypothetical protein ACOCW6_10075 [Spirochaetota bacterium]
MARRSRSLDISLWIQLLTGAFFLTLGILELAYYDSLLGGSFRGFGPAFGRTSRELSLLAAIIELVAGAVLLAAPFVPMGAGVYRIPVLSLTVLWAIRVVYRHVFGTFLEPTFLVWLNRLSLDALVALVLFMLAGRRE